MQEQRDQRDGDRQHDDGAEVGSHRDLSALYYTAPTCCCCQRLAQPVRCTVFSLEEFCCRLAPPILQTTLADRAPGSTGQGPRHLRFRRAAADRRHRSDLGVRLRARLGHPRQGQGPDADLGVLVRAHALDRRQSRAVDRRGDVSRRARAATPTLLRGRSMLVRGPSRCRSNAWRAATCRARAGRTTSATGEVCGIRLPAGLRESDRLPEPIFTPATKAQSGHDINISEDGGRRARRRSACCERVRDLTLRAVRRGRRPRRVARHHRRRHEVRVRAAAGRGRPPAKPLILIDEVLTPDSSRFWPADGYQPGGPQPSFDKQFVRDYLERISWNKQPPVPSLPDESW